jgi:hypothetical protein
MVMFADSEQRFQTVFTACLKAVRCGFPHLAEKHICLPPHEWFDAALARQVLFHLMIEEFDVPKRRVGVEMGIGREAISRGLSVINRRLRDDAFVHSYNAMRVRAELNGA